jgi:hypothetical protein
MENIKVLTFGVGNFVKSQKMLSEHLRSIGITNIIETDYSFLDLDFRKEFEYLLNQKRGYGYWIWKPYLILKELHKLKDNEILIYIDATDLPQKRFFKLIEFELSENTDLLLLNRGYKHGDWTKRDCFVLMDCDKPEYHNAVQLEAGVICLRKTENTIDLLNEWYYWCKNISCLTDVPNICGLDNLSGFQDHRHDQSILTNLAIKYGYNSHNSHESFIRYNYNQPPIY